MLDNAALTRGRHFGEVMAFDAALGVLLERLEVIGELDNTIVVSGDHGAPGFPHGKCNLYDFGTAVPLVVRWGAAPRGRVVDDLVSLPDLAPTFLEAAGLEVPARMTSPARCLDRRGPDSAAGEGPQRGASAPRWSA